jgi:glycine/D-amino acid oxidase-like deaminating enzyme
MAGDEFDFAVVGGGLLGASMAWGLARLGERVVLLDEGDVAHRASRANFALVWVQGKGLGNPSYAGWTKRSADGWADLATALRESSGVDVGFTRPGGFALCLSEAELEGRALALRRLHNQPGMVPYPYDILDHDAVAKAIPQIGPEVVGATYSPFDGHCNSPRLLRALHGGFNALGGTYLANRVVDRISPGLGGFLLDTAEGTIAAGRVVLAAGIGNARLAPMVGLSAPVRPQRGQVIVTERVAPFLHYPLHTVRQTDEGGVMAGDSLEEAGLDNTVGVGVIGTIADRARRMFPLLNGLNVVRSWAGLRVMSPDGYPIYDQSEQCPGAFTMNCHSGVTLAHNHAMVLPAMFRAKKLPDELTVFSARRFDVPAAA